LRVEVPQLPRPVENDPRGPSLVRCLTEGARPLWPGGEVGVARFPFGPGLAEALRRARDAGQVARGLETARARLAAEERGLRLADRRSGVARGARVSRLLVLADDGVERFYRHVETLLRRHGPRVLAVRLEADAVTLGERVLGPGQLARLLLLEHKDAVCAVLLALASQGTGAGG